MVTRGGLAAKVVEPYIKKGDCVYIEGRLRTRSWEDKDGNTRYTTEILCDNLEMLGGRKSEQAETSIQWQNSQNSLHQNQWMTFLFSVTKL